MRVKLRKGVDRSGKKISIKPWKGLSAGTGNPPEHSKNRSKREVKMHEYEVHVHINAQCLKLTISANTPTQARQIAEAQYPNARFITVPRQIR